MVFNSDVLAIALWIIVIIWLLAVTVTVARTMRRYNRLIRGVTKTGLSEVLDHIINTQEILKKHTAALEETVGKLELDARFHIQRVGIVRFNPFSDTGGSQSFSLSLLDKNDNGIVMTSLYARTGNRWYIKKIRAGKSIGLELSKEEESAIRTARPVKDIEDV